jgi:hypothetical protein
MKKVSFHEMSDKVCVKCGKPLKKNLVNKKPNATHCYHCWKKVKP